MVQFADIEQQYERDGQLKKEDIAALEEWQRNQPHLPSPILIEIALILCRCKYSVEVAKQKIDSYFTVRSNTPELFSNRNPFGYEVQVTLSTIVCTALPKQTPDGYLVFYSRLLDTNIHVFDCSMMLKVLCMVMDLTIKQRGCVKGHVIIIDLEGVTFAHFLKVHVSMLRKLAIYLKNASYLREQSIHFVNSVRFVDKFLALAKPFLKNKNKLHAHFTNNATTIYNFVPEDILPIECGGSKFDATEYYQNVTRKNVESNSEYYHLEDSRIVDETLRPGNAQLDSYLFGVEGTFTKLEID